MIVIYMLPYGSDQKSFRLGEKPRRLYRREFDRHETARRYRLGIQAVADGQACRVLMQTPRLMRISFDGTAPSDFHFDSEDERQAFTQGLDDAGGAIAPLIFEADDGQIFQRVQALYAELQAEAA